MSPLPRWMWPLVNAVGLATALSLNGLANSLPLNGMTTGALSDLYPNLFVPIGATFSIWAVIYLWLMGFVGYGFVLARSARKQTPLEVIGPWFGINMLANAAWIVAWHWMLLSVSLLLMGVILGTLIVMYLRLGVGDSVESSDRWLVHAPLSVYMGWITVATIANITALAVDLGAPAFGQGPALATIGVLVAAIAIAARMLWARRDGLYTLVVIWALLGIHLKRAASDEAGSVLVAGAALVGIATLLGGLVVAGARSVQTRRSTNPADT